jgi:TP901 family phage tail tape measure protein
VGKRINIELYVDDQGTPKVRSFSDELEKRTKRAASKAEQALDKFSKDAGAALDRLSGRMRIFGGISAGVLGGLAGRAVIRTGAEFTRTMSSIEAITNSSAQTMARFSGEARTLGASTEFTASQASEAMANLSRAGFAASQTIRVTKDVLDLASAGALGMADAATIASDVIRGMDIEVSQFRRTAGILAVVSNSANTNVQELGDAFRYAGAVGAAAGVSVDDMAASLGVLANRGFRASLAGTGLRRAISVMLGDLEEGEKGIADLGLELFDTEGNFLGLTHAVREFERRFAEMGLTAKEKANLIQESFGMRAGPQMLALIAAGSDALEDMTSRFGDAEAVLERMRRQRLDNLTGDWLLLKSAAQEIALVIFHQLEPAMRDITQAATDFARVIAAWAEGGRALTILSRSAKIAGIAVSALVATQVIRGFRALWAQVLLLNTALEATSLSAIKANASMTTLIGLSLKAKAAMAGIGIATCVVVYQLTRLAMEASGADEIVTSFFERLRQFEGTDLSPEASASAFSNEVLTLNHAVNRLRRDLGEGFEAPGLEAIARFAGAAANQANALLSLKGEALADALERTAGQAQNVRDRIQQLAAVREIMQDAQGATLFRSALEQGLSFAQALESVRAELGRVQSAEEEAEAANRRAAVELEKRINALRKVFGKAGIFTPAMADEFKKTFVGMVETARADGGTLANVVQATQKRLQAYFDGISKAGMEVPEEMRPAWEALQRILGEEQRSKTLEELRKQMLEAGLWSRGLASEILAELQRFDQALQSEGGSAGGITQIEGLREKILQLAAAYRAAGQALPSYLKNLEQLALSHEGAIARSEALAEGWEDLSARMKSAGLASSATAQAFMTSFSAASAAAQEYGVPATLLIRSYRDEILALVEGLRAAGQEIPTHLQSLFELAELDQSRERLEQWKESVSESWRGLGEQIENQFLGLVNVAFSSTQSVGEALKNVGKSILATLIKTLVKLGIQRLLLAKTNVSATQAEATAEMSKAVGLVFANQFASMSGAPFPVNLTAPAVAAAMAAAAAAGVTGAAAAGAALGSGVAGMAGGATPGSAAAGGTAGMATPFARGGIVTQPTLAMIGENSRREAVIPLESQRGREALAGMGGSSVTLNVNLTFTGDNWRDDGQLSPALREVVTDSIRDAISRGLVLPLPEVSG